MSGIKRDFSQSTIEHLNEVIPQIAKKHGLSYFEPQNMTYIF